MFPFTNDGTVADNGTFEVGGQTGTASKKANAKRMTVAVASRGATLRGGATKTFTLRLNAAGRALVAHVDSVAVRVKVSSGGKTIRTATVTVRKHSKAKKKKRKAKKG